MSTHAKRTRKVTSNGWWYWLAHHAERGLIVLDQYAQDGLEEGQLRAYIVENHATEVFDRSSFKEALGGEVSDGDFVRALTRYNSYKESAGLPIKAPPEVAHASFLEVRGLPPQELRRTTRARTLRVTHCWSCKADLDNSIDLECTACNWIICSCGACGCGWTR